MKTTKKALSVLLAVIMIMSSMSVCFGTFTFAANLGGDHSGYTEDPIEYLAEALKSDTITWIGNTYALGNTTNSGTKDKDNAIKYVTDVKLNTYEEYVEVRDILIYLDMAIKGTSEWKKAETTNTDYETRACTDSKEIETELLDALGSVSSQAKEFISYVLTSDKARLHANAKQSGESSTPDSHTATLNIYTEDIKGYLKDVGAYTNVDSEVETGYTYTIAMTEGQYGKKSIFITYKYYHNYIKGIAYGASHPAPSSYKSNTTIKTTVTNYANTVDNTIATYTFEKMATMSISAIDEIIAGLKQARTDIKAIVNRDSLDNYKTLFAGYDTKISNFEATAAKAKEIAAYTETVAEITAYQTANPNYGVFNWGGFDEAEIKAAYNDFMDTYGSIINDATLYEFFTNNGSISDTYVKNFRDNAIAYDLEDLKEDKILPLYNKYALSFPMEGGEEIPLAEKQAAYSNLSGYINNVRSYTEQVQNAIFPESLNTYLDLQEKLECQVAECVLYFAEHVGQDYSNVATEDVIKEIGTAKAQLAALNALLASVDYADNTTLLDSAFENADEFIAYLYSLLGERYTAQVEITDSTYTAIGRPNSNLTIKQYSQLNAYVNGIEQEIVEFLDAEGKGALITAETRNKYAAIDRELMPAFRAFEIDRGFNNYSPEDVLIRREDNSAEIFRQNADLDNDGIGEYEVTDANVNKIVGILEAALKDPTVAKLLGDLINKDEDGNPTGEAFSLSALITNLLNESVFTDELLNTIIQFVYPIVLKEFAKVWAGLPPSITIEDIDTGFLGLKADVEAGLALDDVETAIKSVGLYIGPKALASNLSSKFSSYTKVINKLNEVTIKPSYNLDKDTFRNPWEDEVLFKNVYDESTGEQVFNDDGTPKQVYDLDWGINEAENKRTAFLDAAVAGLSGLEPLLLALLANKSFENPDVTDGDCRGVKVGTGSGSASVGITINLTIDPITLTLTFDANDGWDNALVPIFEALGLQNIPHSEDLQSTRKILENGLLAMIDQLIAKLDANPIQFLLDALPNLAYALEGGLVEPLLHQLKTVINYYADAYYDASVAKGTLQGAMKSEEPVLINIGEMINLKDMGIDISNFAAIWNMIAGGVELLANAEAPDAAYIASLGKLVEKDTNRSVKTYTAGTAGKAYHINANRADVLQYLVKWVLESGLLAGIVEEPSELIAGIFENLEKNSGDAVAAIVELLTQQTIYNAKNFTWFDGTIDGENVLGNSATAIYLNPNNDWTEEKAEYLYNNIDALVASILTMAKLDLDKETEEIDGSIGEVIGGAIDGLLSDKTLTSLAALLAGLDLNALLAGDAEDETATVAEGEETEAPALDVTALINDLLGIDLSVFAAEGGMYKTIAAELEADENYVYDFGVDEGTTTFAAALATLLAPLSKVLDFILAGENLEITLGTEKVTLIGADGYNNGLIPLLEALGCDVTARADLGEKSELEAVINALVARIDALTKGDVIKNIINLLPGVLYFITSNGLSTSVLNLLQPIVVIIDTIRPIYNLKLNDLLAGIEVDFDKDGVKEPLNIDIKNLDWAFIFGLLNDLLGLDLSALAQVIYDVCDDLGVTYTSKSTLESTWKKGAYSTTFSQADMLTVVLSFVLEWATIEDNAAKLDELLKTNGIISSLKDVFADVEITYGTPNWMYWFEDEAAFDAYIASGEGLPNTLASLEYPDGNDWDLETAKYFAENIDVLVDKIIAMINEGKTDDEGNALPTNLADLLSNLVNGLVNADTLNDLVGMITDLLGDIDENLINAAGYLLDVDLAGLKNYTCAADINSISDFINELANVLDKYAGGLVNWLFFGDDYRFAKKSDETDTIVINGGLGYEKGLAMILEALGCELPAEANTKSVLGALATRIDYILKNDVDAEGKVTKSVVDKVLDLLPNLVYFLNANGAGVAVDNLLQPVYALLDKLSAFGLEVNLADLLKITKEDGTEIAIDLANLSLENVVTIVEGATEIPLDAAEAILVNFCTGKITKGTYIYKMEAAREDVITILLVVALELISDDAFAAKLDEMLGTDFIAKIKGIFAPSEIEYAVPDWNYMDGVVTEEGITEYVNAIVSYPNDWTEEKAEYLAENLPALVDTVIKMLEINGVKYDSLAALLQANVNVFTTETLNSLLDLIKNLLGDIDAELLKVGFIIDVDLVGLKNYTVEKEITTVEEFADELAKILTTYAKGAVEWLLLGRDFKLIVKDADGIGDELVANGSYITVNGAQGYAEGLALLLEAIGCKNLPEVYDENGEVKAIDTAATVKAVLTSLATRINEILANPVEEVLDLLPNLIYFLDADGVDAVITNTTAALMALVDKLSVFGIELDINSLVDLPKLMGIEDKYAEGEEKIGLDNLTLVALLKAVSLMTGLDLTELQNVLVPFALGEAVKYDSVSASDAYKMVYKTDLDKHDMLSVIVTAALRMFFAGTETSDKNAAKLDEMLGTDIISALKDVFASVEILYTAPDWNYADADNGTVDAMKYAITYPNNWNEETAEYVTDVLLSDDFDKLIAGLIEDGKYESLSDLLKAKVNVFTTENLQAIVDLIADLLKDIDDGLLEAAGVLLGADVVGLKAYKAPADITTVDAFAKELAKVLNTYAKGVVEWLLLGNDYTFFVKEVDENGLPVDFITLNGAKGYEAGLVLLLEALGCENLPALYDENGEALELDTAETVEAVLTSLAARIDAILSDPIEEVIALLPNLFYFLNTNGVAAVIKNTTAALTALSKKINVLAPDVNLDVASMVDLKELLKLPEDAALSMENLSMAAVLEAVGMLVGLDLTKVEDVLVGFALGEYDNAYKSESKLVGTPKKMIYTDNSDEAKMVTVVANLVLLTLADEANAEFLKGLVGEDVYKVILNVLQIKEAELKKMSWQHTDKVGQSFNAMTSSENYKGYGYGPRYTEEMADYIAENIGEFVDNIIYLLGIEIEGESVESLKEILKNLVNGNLYNSANIVAIRDALAGLLDKIAGLEVNSVVVGGYIVDVLKTSLGVDVTAVAKVEVPEFTEDKEQFITYLGNVVEPLGPILNWILTDEDIAFFAKEGEDGKPTDFIKLPGNAGYKNGIVLLLEALGCEDIEDPADLEGASGSAIVTDIAEPLLNRLDEIINNPAEELLAVLPNLIYFINSNGVDVVVKNTLNAVYTILNAIEPIAKIDLYELIGLDLETLTFEKLIDMLLKNLEIAGFKFTEIPMDTFVELTVGKLETYNSLSAEDPAYRMVYDENSASKGDMVTVLLRLVITFILTENNREVLINLLKSELGMSADAEKYVAALFKALADCTIGNQLGMDSALATIYYVYYGVDKGVGEAADGKRDLDKAWQAKLKELGYSDNKDEQSVGNLITDILDIVFNDQGNVPDDGGNDVLDKDGLASNGFISFFQRIKIFFEEIAAFFRELFSFGK